MKKSILALSTEEIRSLVETKSAAIETATVTVYNSKKAPVKLAVRFLTSSGGCAVTREENPEAFNAWRAASQVVTAQAMGKAAHGELAAARAGHAVKRNAASFGCRVKFEDASRVPAVVAWSAALKQVSELRGLVLLLAERDAAEALAAKKAAKLAEAAKNPAPAK